ncbi:MAG: THUMP domain-containing protein, partial [Oscillospiraceae bacterium]
MKNCDLILLKYGEIALKGLNRPMFERKLIDNIASALSSLGHFSIKRSQSTIYVESLSDGADMMAVVKRLQKVFGIVNICPVTRCEKNVDDIAKIAIACMKELDTAGRTFKVECKREDKQFPLNSPQLAAEIGGRILENVPGLSVDVHKPDIVLQVEVRRDAYVFAEKFSGAGGMPIGTSGRAALLLSGGIDSPVAGYMIAKRGVMLDAVHFHSHPYTSD